MVNEIEIYPAFEYILENDLETVCEKKLRKASLQEYYIILQKKILNK